VKEHKKDKHGSDGKRQIILQNSMNQPLLIMSGKSKHGGGNVEVCSLRYSLKPLFYFLFFFTFFR